MRNTARAAKDQAVSGGSNSLSPGVVGAIVLVVVCVVAALVLYQLWRRNPKFKAYLILQWRKRKFLNGT